MRVTSKTAFVVNICIVLLSIAIFLLGIYITKESYRVKDTFLKTTGTIYNIKIERDYGSDVLTTMEYPQIEFSLPNGKKTRFTADYSRENVKYKIGDQIEIYYNPRKPTEARIADYRSLILPGIIVICMGIIFFIFSGQYVIKYFNRKKIIAKLKTSGIKIQAPFIDAKEDLETTIMEKHPVTIHVQLEDGTSLFSDEIWDFNPESLKPGQMVDIYLDPNDKNTYHIDTEPFTSSK